ncbi:Rieske 2Fe-2S domain-containing protein [Hydrogenophaga defluvii]|uniref:Rieske 2Fe-2S domain-containing protein n=1 Tax=Hydrogenophaga defluvii TaxID=249410 RepID=A0ABW2S805_9BURK
MIETQHWWPVAQVSAAVSAPFPVRLLDHDLVLWRDGQGRLAAAHDRCPHRGARLSLGRVCDGQLECPYHGWRFDADGPCRHVPALPDFVPPASQRLRTVGVREAHGLIWVCVDGDSGDLPAFSTESDSRLRKLNCGPYDVATSAPRIVENFLDMTHFAFVHEGWLGERGHAAHHDHPVERTPSGLIATGCQAWQPQSNRLSSGGAMVDYTYEVTGPFSAVLTKRPDDPALGDYHEAIGLFICPLTPETSRVWFRLAMADFASSDEALRAFQHTIFTQDQPVLESQHPKCLPLDPRAEQHTTADRVSLAYRRFLRDSGITFGVIA